MRFHAAAFAAVLSASAVSSTTAFGFSPVAVPRATIANSRSNTNSNGSSSRLGPNRPFGIVPSARHAPSPTSLSLAAGGGPEALEEYIQTLATVSKSSKFQNPKMVKLVGVAALPLSYIVGAAMTPSRRLAARAVGGVVAAVTAGGVGKSALEEDVRKACPAAIAQRVLDLGLDDTNIADGIKRLQEDYGVDDEDFATMCTNVYSVYLVGMAKNPLTKTAELKELSSLRNALDLDNQQTGQGHADAAVQFYRDILRYTTEDELDDEDHPDRISLDKLLFLSERAFRQGGETDEAFTFEFSRVAKNLGGIEMEEAMDRVRDVALPFYERALSSTRSKLESGAVSSDMLTRARATLGIDEADAKDMHIEAFGKEVRVQLGLSEEDDEGDEELDYDEGNRLGTEADALKKLEEMTKAEEKKSKVIKDTSGIKFKDGAYGHDASLLISFLPFARNFHYPNHAQLSKLQEVLSLTDEDADYEISAATTEYWRNTALVALQDAVDKTKTPEKAWEIISARQKELFLKDSNMKDMMINIIMQTMGKPLEKVNGFSRVNNAAATYDGLMDAIAAKETCKEVLKNAGWTEFEDFEDACFDPDDSQSACGFLSRLDRQQMYNIFFGRSVKTTDEGRKTLDDEARARLKELRSMLGISDAEGENQIRAFFGPELQSVLSTATDDILEGNVNDVLMKELQNNVDQVIADFQLDDEMVRAFAGPLYDNAVRQIASNTPGGIPSKEEVATLASLRDLLRIKEDETYQIHIDCFGGAYKKGIKEALGTTGVIREEFREPLNDLRSRLGVSEEDAKDIYLEALGERMQPMVEYISNEMERLVLTNDQLAQKRGTDYGEDFFKSGAKASILHRADIVFLNVSSSRESLVWAQTATS
eukprot:scaffold1009_cov188-Alexandrium_tamarense.AAC.31